MEAKKFLEKMIGPMTVGKLIRAYRTQNDLSAQELADKLGVTKGFISNVETGKKDISLGKALELAEDLGESKDLYAGVWFESQARSAGLDFKKVIKKLAS